MNLGSLVLPSHQVHLSALVHHGFHGTQLAQLDLVDQKVLQDQVHPFVPVIQVTQVSQGFLVLQALPLDLFDQVIQAVLGYHLVQLGQWHQ